MQQSYCSKNSLMMIISKMMRDAAAISVTYNKLDDIIRSVEFHSHTIHCKDLL